MVANLRRTIEKFAGQLFQKLNKHTKRRQVVDESLFHKLYINLANKRHKPFELLDARMTNNISKMQEDPMQGQPGSSKMLHALHQQYCLPNLAEQVQQFVEDRANCIKEKSYTESKLDPPFQRVNDSCDSTTDFMEINFFGELHNCKGSTHILTATDVLSRYLVAVTLKEDRIIYRRENTDALFHTTRVYAPTHPNR